MEDPPLPPDPQLAAKMTSQSKDYSPAMPAAAFPLPLPVQGQPRPNTATRRMISTETPTPMKVQSPQQPITDAVNDAFVRTPVVQSELDPELVRQVTEQVIKNLQNITLPSANGPSDTTTPTQALKSPLERPSTVQPVPRSPTQSSTGSVSQRYTRPSPYNSADITASPVASDSGSSFSKDSSDSNWQKDTINDRKETRSQWKDGMADLERSTTLPSISRSVESDGELPRRRGSGPDALTRDAPPTKYQTSERNFSGSSVDPSGVEARNRTRQTRAPSDVAEATTLEKIWQPLFESGGPTRRLGQFLRGLALHLIDDYEPRYSFVVTPEKMKRFFTEVRVPDEHYPWDTIFGGAMSNASLSSMYRKLLCQHHLIQNQLHEPPSVAGLTPSGFEHFMTCLIQAHPDTEYERLARAVMNMPISNADDKSERFPKELSRRLLPARPNLQAEQRLVSSLNHEPKVQLRGASHMPPPPPPPAAAQMQTKPWAERERKPYSQATCEVDDEDLLRSTRPIERERKPYSGKEGSGGQAYGAENERSESRRKGSQGGAPRPSKTGSTQPPPSGYSASASSDPMNIPQPMSGQRTSTGSGMPYIASSYSRSSRRSPPPRNPYTSSEPLDVNSSQPPSNFHSASQTTGGPRDQSTTGDVDDDSGRRYSRRDRRGSNEDDHISRGYPIPPRPPPSSQFFDPAHSSVGGPPIGSFGGPRDRPSVASQEDRHEPRREGRRSTWYGTPGAGGSDGYGSFPANNGGPYQPPQPYGSSAQH